MFPANLNSVYVKFFSCTLNTSLEGHDVYNKENVYGYSDLVENSYNLVSLVKFLHDDNVQKMLQFVS